MRFILHYNRFGHKRSDRDVWVIRCRRWVRYCRRVVALVPLRSVYLGDTAPQPRAYFRGEGVVRIVNGEARITRD